MGHDRVEEAKDRDRRGFSVVEALVALTILSVCAGIFVQIALWHLEHGVRLRRRALALEHATNTLEELRSRSWEDLQADFEQEIPLPEHLSKRRTPEGKVVHGRIPEGVVHIRVEPFEDDRVTARRISVKVTWTDRPSSIVQDRWSRFVELVAFRSPRTVDEPASE